MKMDIEWKGNMKFEGIGETGRRLIIEGSTDDDEQNKGQTPMEAVLSALGGCTGIDVISILNKMRMELDSFSIDIDSERAEEHPKIFEKIHINYKLTGKDLNERKVKKAIELTQDKYCSVSKSLKAIITYSYEINGTKFE